MKRLVMLSALLLLTSSCVANAASKNKHNFSQYDFTLWGKYQVKGSENSYKFQSNLKEDKDVTTEIKNNKKTGLISYLLFEDGKIVIDESDLPEFIKNNKGLLPSHSIGKSLVSYVAGHAICEGYIDSVDVKLDDWATIKNTLYDGQVLIDLLNMKAGDQSYIGHYTYRTDNKIKGTGVNINTFPLKDVMELDIIQNARKSVPTYNYNALITNTIMNYIIHKTNGDWEKLLHKVFNQHVKVKNNVHFLKTERQKFSYEPPSAFSGTELGRYSFYASRYDYLRIAKTMMDDWNNDTCAGKYLKTMYERRIGKNREDSGWANGNKQRDYYFKSYGGQFHFDLVGLTNRKALAMSGFGGQHIYIDFDAKRIVIAHAKHRDYNWKSTVYNKIK